MKTWLVACSKGGVGKTTLATHLAAACALGGRGTVMVDADPQGSARDWLEARQSPAKKDQIVATLTARSVRLD